MTSWRAAGNVEQPGSCSSIKHRPPKFHLSGGRISDPAVLHKVFTNTFDLAKRPFTLWVLVSLRPFHFPLGPQGELPPSHLHGNLQATEISTWSTEQFFRRMWLLVCALCVPRGCSGLLPGALSYKVHVTVLSGKRTALIFLTDIFCGGRLSRS